MVNGIGQADAVAFGQALASLVATGAVNAESVAEPDALPGLPGGQSGYRHLPEPRPSTFTTSVTTRAPVHTWSWSQPCAGGPCSSIAASFPHSAGRSSRRRPPGPGRAGAAGPPAARARRHRRRTSVSPAAARRPPHTGPGREQLGGPHPQRLASRAFPGGHPAAVCVPHALRCSAVAAYRPRAGRHRSDLKAPKPVSLPQQFQGRRSQWVGWSARPWSHAVPSGSGPRSLTSYK